MATRSEAKRALWEASKKDDAARAFIAKFLAENAQDGPGGLVADAALANGVKTLKPKLVRKVK